MIPTLYYMHNRNLCDSVIYFRWKRGTFNIFQLGFSDDNLKLCTVLRCSQEGSLYEDNTTRQAFCFLNNERERFAEDKSVTDLAPHTVNSTFVVLSTLFHPISISYTQIFYHHLTNLRPPCIQFSNT